MSSDQKAVIALINRSMLLIQELNETRREKRALEGRLAESEERVTVLEAQLASGMPSDATATASGAGAASVEAPPLRAA
jgi:hypothetical protein